MTDEIPQWAKERANLLGSRGVLVSSFPMRDAFARYISEHEQPPVDPLLIEARAILSSESWRGIDLSGGRYDQSAEMTQVLAALRRGIEIGEARK